MRMEQNNMDSSKVLVNTETGATYSLPEEPNYEYFRTLAFGKRPLLSLINFMA